MIRDEFYRPPELIVPPSEFIPLDSADPLDVQMIAYYNANAAEEFLDAAEQEMLVRGTRAGDVSPAEAIQEAYAGLVATVAFPYKGHGVDSSELLRLGGQGLVIAAQAYGRGNISEFDDKAVYAIEWALNKAIPGTSRNFSAPSEERPMEQVQSFLESLEPSIKQEELNRRILEDFTPLQRKVLPLLHLGTHDDIAEALGTDRIFVNNMTANVQRTFGLHNTTSIALMLHARGYQYPIKSPDKPLVELLTDHQLTIGNLLHYEYDDIGKLAGDRNARQIAVSIHKMKKKTGARSRTELALMIAMFDTGERRNPEGVLSRKLGELAAKVGLGSLELDQAERLIAETDPQQQEALMPFYLTGRETSWKEVAGQLDISPKTAKRKGEAGIRSIRDNLAER